MSCICSYSGQTSKLSEMPEELLEAANKYKLDRLKMLCEQELSKSINTENACKFFVLAARYNTINLKANIINFVKKNAKKVDKK